jgi:hypothetical protein
MATTTDVREWLKDHQAEHGQEVPTKGRIPAHLQAVYDAGISEEGQAAMDVLYDRGDPAYTVPVGDAYDLGVTDADFITADEPPDPEPGTAEVAPRRIRAARKEQAKSLRERIWGGGSTKGKRPAKKHPRVSLKGFAEDVFLDLAWTFQGLPPLEKVLYLEAPLAGQVVEDTCKGTVADTVLQPIARIDRQFKALEALTAPAWVAAIMVKGEKEASGDYTPATKLMFGGLRHALLSLSRVADVDFDQLKQKSEELKGKSDEIDGMIAWLFEMPELSAEQAAAMAAANGQAA